MGCRGWTGFLHRFNYPFIMKTNLTLFPTLRRLVKCTILSCFVTCISTQSVGL
ncbi:hypothetical protein KsCSTR_23490 [Candidatus Kuenenia stuttgartiensis]|uniref:Uncharacterized protein n=1 Tax=Kuenenia stuttgartiensis TaxID=174633 RepID=Q1Q3M1_KUEST|nr:hypothetical protein KsCSTR_23490 [Candidatus Kuenenia stuttgartiensis]CAJ74617.1 unknown protein [Candidatus Kuenenia stuttgartiensis]